MPQDNKNLGVTQITDTAPPSNIFFPDPALMPPTGDAYSQLTQLLTQLQSQQYQPPKQGALETILTALAQGASIAASNDPGTALSNILSQRQQIQQNRENQERARQGQIQTAMVQGALDKARNVTQEQQTARKEGREFGYKGAESQLQIETQKQIDLNKLDIAQREAIQNNDLANRFSVDQSMRTKRDALAKAAPELFAKGIEIQSLMQTIVPDMPREIAASIARKQSGQEPPNYTPTENEWYNKYVQARNEEYKTDKDLARRVKESEITQNKAMALYYQNSKVQDRYQNALNTNLGNAMADSIDTIYYRVKNGIIYSDKEVKALSASNPTWGIINKPVPLTEEENKQQVLNNVQKQKQLESVVMQNKATNNPMPGQTTTKLNAEQIIQDARAKGRTDEQIKVILKANGFDPNLVNPKKTKLPYNINPKDIIK